MNQNLRSEVAVTDVGRGQKAVCRSQKRTREAEGLGVVARDAAASLLRLSQFTVK